MKGAILAAVVAIACSPGVAMAGGKKLTVYVTAPKVQDAQGFIEPIATQALEDSRRDFVSHGYALRAYKLVKDRAHADVVLTIIARGSQSQVWGASAISVPYFGGSMTIAQPKSETTRWVNAEISIGDSALSTLHAETAGGSWVSCADKLSTYLTEWVKANRDRINSLLAEKR
jgi:hypothetical protein